MLVPSVGGVGQDQLQPGGQPSQYGWRGYPWHCSSVTKWPHKPVTLPNMSMLKKTWNVNSGCQASISVHICWTTVFYIRGNVKRYKFSCFEIVYISCHTNILFWVYQTQKQILNLSLNWSNSHRRKIKLWKHGHMFDCQHRIPLLINIQKSFSVQKLIVTVFHLSLKLLELFKIYINMACTKYKSKSQAPIHIREIRMLCGKVKSAIILRWH